MAKKKNYDNDIKYLLYTTLAVLIILLSIFNLQQTNKIPGKVLGANLEMNSPKFGKERTFWEEFQIKNPTYIDGWLELGRLDKVREIDPNYFSR